MESRYTFGGDEFIFVEISESMSLESFFKGMAITQKLIDLKIEGITEICPSNASYQVRFNPEIISHDILLNKLKQLEKDIQNVPILNTRFIEIPVFFNDPWTLETGARFRDRHQDPKSNDVDYLSKINGFSTSNELINALCNSPWIVSMVGFVGGLPWMYQMVEQERQIQAPKYLRPRTDTPKLTLGFGGCFACIYSVRGAGGYQMCGITPAPIFDHEQKVDYLKDNMILFRPGDIVRFKSINRETYDKNIKEVDEGVFKLNMLNINFNRNEFIENPTQYNKKLLGQILWNEQ